MFIFTYNNNKKNSLNEKKKCSLQEVYYRKVQSQKDNKNHLKVKLSIINNKSEKSLGRRVSSMPGEDCAQQL